MGKKRLYSVKEVMNICNISRTQLFYYEDKGLVLPVRHEDNQYRYYSDEQVAKINYIKSCRDAGFSFDSITSMLAEPGAHTLRDAIVQAIADARKKLDESVTQYERSMSQYTSMLEASAILTQSPVVRIEHLPAHYVVLYEVTGKWEDDVLTFYTNYSELDRIAERTKCTLISPKKAWFTHLLDETGAFYLNEQQLRLFYEIRKPVGTSKNFKTIPAMDCLTLNHIGNYTDSLEDSYQKIYDYAKENQISLKNESIEEYTIEASLAYNNPDVWVTKILIPINSTL